MYRSGRAGSRGTCQFDIPSFTPGKKASHIKLQILPWLLPLIPLLGGIDLALRLLREGESAGTYSKKGQYEFPLKRNVFAGSKLKQLKS